MWRFAGTSLPQLLLQQLERATGWAARRAAPAASQTSHLSTLPAAESVWQQTLRAGSAAMGGGGISSGASQRVLQAAHPLPAQLPQRLQTADGWASAAKPLPVASQHPHIIHDSLALVAEADDLLAQLKASAPHSPKSKQRRKRKANSRQLEAGHEQEAASLAPEPATSLAANPDGQSSGIDSSKGLNGSGAPPKAKLSKRARRKLEQQQQLQQQQMQALEGVESVLQEEQRVIDHAPAVVAAVDVAQGVGFCQLPPPIVLQDDVHPIRNGDISRPAWLILSRLRAAGHEAYVVGGTIRDLLLGGTPKDYDLLTTAELHQIKRLFSRCSIVGKSFPVCHVHTEGTMIEVTSFTTNADRRLIPADASTHMIGRQKPKRHGQAESDATWAAARAGNAARRDFTVNGLLYDPFSRLLFDAVGGVADCRARRLRTICPPQESFATDPARILRGVRLAARAGLELEPETAAAMEEQAGTIGLLPQGRLQMELSSLLGYGASERSLKLTWRLGLLDMLLPQHALYLHRHRMPRAARPPPFPKRRYKHDLLFELAAELDRHVHPQRPVDPSVWIALLAAPLVADECDRLARKQRRRQNQKQRRVAAAADKRRQQAEQQQEGGAAALLPGDDEMKAIGSGAYGGVGTADSSSGSIGSSSSGGLEEEGQGRSEGDEEELGGGATVHLPQAHAQDRRDQGQQDQEARQHYVEQYSQVVADVLESMQQALDVATMETLGLQAKKHSEQLLSGGSKAAWKRRLRGPEAQVGVLLPCVLPKAALDRAAALLLLEVDLRGQPDLLSLLDKGKSPSATQSSLASVTAELLDDAWPEEEEEVGEQEQEQLQEPQQHAVQQGAGRHNSQHQLWHRLERALAGVEKGEARRGDTAAITASAADVEPASALRRHRQGRRLSAEERLVLGILSNPRFGYAARTALAGGGKLSATVID